MKNYLTSNPSIYKIEDYINGLLLGDGHINCRSSKTGIYSHSCKYEDWIYNISEYFCERGVDSNVWRFNRYGGFCPKRGSFVFNLETYSYVEFKIIRDKWYKKWFDIDNYTERRWHLDVESGDYFIWRKVIPKDILLTPECVSNWYLGDGTIPRNLHRSGYRLSLSTNDFLREDTEFLSCLLSDVLDIRTIINKRGIIEINNSGDIGTFLNYISEFRISCYDYKFPEEAMV